MNKINLLKSLANHLDDCGFILEASEVDDLINNFEKDGVVKELFLKTLKCLDLYPEKDFDLCNKKDLKGMCSKKLKEVIVKSLENSGEYDLMTKMQEYNHDEIKSKAVEFFDVYFKKGVDANVNDKKGS